MHKLTEFMAQVSDLGDERATLDGAIVRIAEALDAESVSVVVHGRVVASIGFPRDRIPDSQVVATAAGEATTVDVPGPGLCHAVPVPVDDLPGTTVVIARAHGPLRREEASLAKGMSRVLGLVIRDLRVLEQERTMREEGVQRAELLERLARIQQSISAHAPLENVLDAVTAGAASLLGDSVVGLRLIAGEDPTTLQMVSSIGIPEHLAGSLAASSVGVGAGGRAVTENRLVVVDAYQDDNNVLEPFRDDGLQAAMAAPVTEDGRVIGSLTVASYDCNRRYTTVEQDALQAFASQAGVALANGRLVEETQNALAQVTRQALHDSLTDLPNRVLFLDRVEHALNRSRRTGTEVAVLFIDLDNFKFVNDALGHDTGDRLLVEVAHRLDDTTRAADTAARFGGDEFAVLIEATATCDEVMDAAERVLHALQSPFSVGDHQLHVNASIGVAIGTPSFHAARELLRQADVAMYRAKATGKGRATLFSADMQTPLIHRVNLERDIRAAVADEQLDLHYQPIIDLHTGAVVGAEALLRWDHPNHGPIPPNVFIPLAEETGLILTLGQWALQRACDAASAWRDAGHDITMSVNLSVFQLQHDSLVDTVRTVLANTNTDPRQLVLEITETMLFHDIDSSARRLDELSDLGVGLALDDFGTGYSSLSYLDRFPIDTIKIDCSFTQAIASTGDRSHLAGAIVQLANILGLRCIGEGVETEDQLCRLRTLGCDLAQGYHLCAPVSHEDFLDHLEQTRYNLEASIVS